jgi:excinuclease ABC subunit B
MKKAIHETDRRRKIQDSFNRKHGITPESIRKAIPDILQSIYEADYVTIPMAAEKPEEYVSLFEIPKLLSRLKKEMREAASRLDFERAAELRDRIKSLQEQELSARETGPAGVAK